MNDSRRKLIATFAVLAFVMCTFTTFAIVDDDNEAEAATVNKSGSAISGTVGTSINIRVSNSIASVNSQSAFNQFSISSSDLPAGLSASLKYNSGAGTLNRLELYVTGTPTENASGTYSIDVTRSGTTYHVTGSVSITGGTVSVSSISISGSTSAEVGDSITYTASVSPSNADNKAVTWSISSGASYATITSQNDSSCTVKFNSAGSVTIKATADDGSGTTATRTVSVTKPDVPVTSITISGSSSAEVGDTKTYTVSVSPSNATDKGITWSISSGSSSATIISQSNTSCTVSFTAAGSVTLRATADDGYGEYDTHSITISEPDIPVTSITISGSTSVEVGDSVRYTVSVSPSGATDKGITWSISSGSNRAQITSQSDTSCTVKFTAAGSVTLKATADDGYGEYDTLTITVSNPMVAYTLTYNANGGSNAPLSQTVNSSTGSATFTLRTNEPTWDGHIFLGWNTNSAGTGTMYEPGETYTTSSTNTTLYAVWEEAVINITSPIPSDLSLIVGEMFSYTVTADVSGCTVQVSGVDWLGVSGMTISGTPTTAGSYPITITVLKDGYTSDTMEFTLIVSSSLAFTSAPSTGVIAYAV